MHLIFGVIVSLVVVTSFRLTTRISRVSLSLGAGKPVDVTFEPSGKVIVAEQGDLISDVIKKAKV